MQKYRKAGPALIYGERAVTFAPFLFFYPIECHPGCNFRRQVKKRDHNSQAVALTKRAPPGARTGSQHLIDG